MGRGSANRLENLGSCYHRRRIIGWTDPILVLYLHLTQTLTGAYESDNIPLDPLS